MAKDLAARLDYFKSRCNSKESALTEILDIQKQIRFEIDEMNERLGPANLFIYELRKEKLWNKLVEPLRDSPFIFAIKIDLGARDIYGLFEYVFSKFETKLKLTSDSVESFWQKLLSDTLIQKKIDNYANALFKTPEKAKENINIVFSSIFINKFIQDDSVIDLKNIPDEFKKCLGLELKRGTLNIDQAGPACGADATGGTINVGVAGTGAGAHNKGATIKINIAEGSVGRDMTSGRINVGKTLVSGAISNVKGGVIAAKSAGHDLGKLEKAVVFCDTSGDNLGVENQTESVIICNHAGENIGISAKGGTILIEKSTKEMPMSYGRGLGLYFYFDKKCTYEDMNFNHAPSIQTKYDLDDFIEGKMGLVIIDHDYQKVRTSTKQVTDGQKGGIIVLRRLHDKDTQLGYGMAGGALIIESDLFPDEVRERLSNEGRTGGIILMRVPDPSFNDPLGTKLIDLEDDWLERTGINGKQPKI